MSCSLNLAEEEEAGEDVFPNNPSVGSKLDLRLPTIGGIVEGGPAVKDDNTFGFDPRLTEIKFEVDTEASGIIPLVPVELDPALEPALRAPGTITIRAPSGEDESDEPAVEYPSWLR